MTSVPSEPSDESIDDGSGCWAILHDHALDGDLRARCSRELYHWCRARSLSKGRLGHNKSKERREETRRQYLLPQDKTIHIPRTIRFSLNACKVRRSIHRKKRLTDERQQPYTNCFVIGRSKSSFASSSLTSDRECSRFVRWRLRRFTRRMSWFASSSPNDIS